LGAAHRSARRATPNSDPPVRGRCPGASRKRTATNRRRFDASHARLGDLLAGDGRASDRIRQAVEAYFGIPGGTQNP
jgi:hypothetical protein